MANVGKVVRPGGDVYILGFVVDDSRISPLETVGLNLFFLNIYDEGQAYTENEHRGWLSAAGFGEIARFALPEGRSVIKARKLG